MPTYQGYFLGFPLLSFAYLNGTGVPQRNKNGGTFCQEDSYMKQKEAAVYLSDLDMFKLLKREIWKERHDDAAEAA